MSTWASSIVLHIVTFVYMLAFVLKKICSLNFRFQLSGYLVKLTIFDETK